MLFNLYCFIININKIFGRDTQKFITMKIKSYIVKCLKINKDVVPD